MRSIARNIVITPKGDEILRKLERDHPASPLTPDQSYAMTRICEGAKCTEIAKEMAVEPPAIAQFLRRAAKRLGTDSRVVACTRFMQTDAWKRTHG
jgi:DNA-binding NarL/FixJ family response regulator